MQTLQVSVVEISSEFKSRWFFLMNPLWSIVASRAVNQLYVYIILFWISFPFGLPQSTDQGSLNHTVGAHQLSSEQRRRGCKLELRAGCSVVP